MRPGEREAHQHGLGFEDGGAEVGIHFGRLYRNQRMCHDRICILHETVYGGGVSKQKRPRSQQGPRGPALRKVDSQMRALTLTIVVLLAAAAPASAKNPKTAKLPVGESRVTWVSPETFPARAQVAITVTWGRFDLEMSGEGRCVAYLNGHGIAARVSFCGHSGRIPIRARVVSAREKPTSVKITYEQF